MVINTRLKKLIVSNGNPIQYQLYTDNGLLLLNDFIGKEIKIEFTGKIYCKSYGKPTKRSFNQGFCYPCFRSVPEAAPCIIRPELCRAHLGHHQKLFCILHDILQEHPAGIREYDLLVILKEKEIPLFFHGNFSDTLVLFKAHFMLFHLLYSLRDYLNKENTLEPGKDQGVATEPDQHHDTGVV